MRSIRLKGLQSLQVEFSKSRPARLSGLSRETPSGAKARTRVVASAAWLKPCPPTLSSKLGHGRTCPYPLPLIPRRIRKTKDGNCQPSQNPTIQEA